MTSDFLIWDAHSGFAPDPSADLDQLSRWTDAGVGFLSINVGFDLMRWDAVVRTIAAFRHWLLARPDRFVLAERAADVRRARAEGRLAVAFDIEGMATLDGRIEMVALYHALGVRQMLFAYNRNNAAGGGCHDEDGGLTDFGRQVIDEMDRLGMVVDVSHAGYRTSMDAMERAAGPVIFSHSNARVLTPHGRNITDEQARACAATGGVVGVAGIDLFLGRGAPPAERMADHIDHFVSVAGIAHVGLGLDHGFPVPGVDIGAMLAAHTAYWPAAEGYFDAPIAYLPPSGLAGVIERLRRRGYDDAALAAVLGGNFLRVAERVWR